jgi:hypothetical protein
MESYEEGENFFNVISRENVIWTYIISGFHCSQMKLLKANKRARMVPVKDCFVEHRDFILNQLR